MVKVDALAAHTVTIVYIQNPRQKRGFFVLFFWLFIEGGGMIGTFLLLVGECAVVLFRRVCLKVLHG